MFLLFDIGGTNMRLAISRDGKTFEDPKIVPTPERFADGIAALCSIATELAGGESLAGVVGGIPGSLNREKTMLLRSPNLSDWAGKPLAAELKKCLQTPVTLQNDAALVGLGEATVGAGKGYNIVVYLTISTGVGGARIVGEKIDVNTFGFEPGHQIIDPTGTLCPDCVGSPGTLETRISGTSLMQRFGKHAKEVSDPVVWKQLAQCLAYGLNNTILHWSPDVVVLGGSMITGEPAISLERTSEYLKEVLDIFPELPPLKKAELADTGGLHGALAMIKASL